MGRTASAALPDAMPEAVCQAGSRKLEAVPGDLPYVLQEGGSWKPEVLREALPQGLSEAGSRKPEAVRPEALPNPESGIRMPCRKEAVSDA